MDSGRSTIYTKRGASAKMTKGWPHTAPRVGDAKLARARCIRSWVLTIISITLIIMICYWR